jgi:hypothetical protein
MCVGVVPELAIKYKWKEFRFTRYDQSIESDLMSQNPNIDLFQLESIGRRKARILHNHGYTTLLDASLSQNIGNLGGVFLGYSDLTASS